mgnify:CR=1 FL=1
MQAAFFWIFFFLISFWALKTFYFSRSLTKLIHLRKAAFWINYIVLILFFFSWLPLAQGRTTGWELIQRGNELVIFLGILIVGSLLAFLTRSRTFLKTGVVTHIVSSIMFIAVMINLMPGTVILDFGSIAPIVASLLLLSGNVAVLLLWQQLG